MNGRSIARGLALAAALALGACSHRPSEDDCNRLLAHFLDVEGEAATVGQFTDLPPPMKGALADEKARFATALRGPFVALCKKELSPGEVECALAAGTEEAMDACERR